MKIGIYTPYLDSFGGGERYILTIAETLSKMHTVDLFLDNHHLTLKPEELKEDLGKHLNLNLSKINLIKSPIGKGGQFLKRLFFLRRYDVIIYLTDGSIFYSTAKKNIIHFQVPFKNTSANSIWGKIKLSSWNLAMCNSKFTSSIIAREWPLKTTVVYPPVDIEKINPLKKEKQILSVGRFASFTKSKKHEEMIQAFIKLVKENSLTGWSLHLAGSVEGDANYLKELQKLAGNYPIYFYPDCPFNDLIRLYGESSIYWHVAGFEEVDPTKMEHFGISTVEAMAGGCVPVVINKGGQPEIVEDEKSGLLWNSLDELEKNTLKLINNPKLMEKLSKNVILRSKLFSKEKFIEKVDTMLTNIQ